MMTLIKEELYKLGSKMIVRVSTIAALLLVLFVFFSFGPLNERSRIDGVDYSGYAAIHKDREVSQEFTGVLTDDKIRDMAKRAGFLEAYIKDGNGGYTNANYINTFLTDNHLTNGVYNDWDKYQMATDTIPLAETAMGSLIEDQKIRFAYTKGWEVFPIVSSFGAILGCLLIIIVITPLFADEYTLKKAAILLTTAHGKSKDIWGKMIAGLIFAVSAMLGIQLFVFLLCGTSYGFQGLDVLAGTMNGVWYLPAHGMGSVSFVPIWQYFLMCWAVQLVGGVGMTAFAMVLSAVSKQSFTALLGASIFYILPAAVWIYLLMVNQTSGFTMILRRIIYCTPLYSCMNGTVAESATRIMSMWRGIVCTIITIPSVGMAYYKYRNYQVS